MSTAANIKSVTTPKTVALVLADISGYTRFIRLHGLSMLHAEQIIAELLDAVIGASEHPLQLSKLEGDAAFMYAEVPLVPAALQDILRQMRFFWNAFGAKRDELITVTDGG